MRYWCLMVASLASTQKERVRISYTAQLFLNKKQQIDMKNSEFVFVILYIMLGDADGSIDGCRVLLREDWEKDVKVFKEHLSKHGLSEVEGDSEWGIYSVDMSNYTVKACSSEEAKILKKFIGESQGDFRLPSEFI